MIELVFDDSACGSLKMAQHYGEGMFQKGLFSVILSRSDGKKPTRAEVKAAQRRAEENARIEWEQAVPMGGNASDVFGLNLAWSIGDISDDCIGDSRLHVLERQFSVLPFDEAKRQALEVLDRMIAELKTIRSRMEAGVTVRIWYSDCPDDMCSLYWFMAQLEHWNINDPEILVVKLPEWEADGTDAVLKKAWGEVSPGQWYRYLKDQKPLPASLDRSFASRWRELQKENAPLRAVLNGSLVSMPETLYDDLIRREIALEEDEFQEAVVIGRVISKYQLRIGDGWIASRIETMIQNGELAPVSKVPEGGLSYHRCLKKL